jgi:thioredoxin-like negative regulator of GroEL
MTKGQRNITSSKESSANDVTAEVLMLMGTHCTFCGPMMQVLSKLMKQGYISELQIVNIEQNPDLAQRLGVRSVPWLQIGPFELQGVRTEQELLEWLKRAASFEGVNEYLEEILAEGNIAYARKLLERYPQALNNVVELMADADAKINVRLGVGALIEEQAESDRFKAVIPRLLDYLSYDDARVRGDACHYLSLTKDRAYVDTIKKLLDDESEEVREIAQDSLDALDS